MAVALSIDWMEDRRRLLFGALLFGIAEFLSVV